MNSFIANIALGLLLSEVASTLGSVDLKAFEVELNTKINTVVTNTQIQATVDGLVDTIVDVAGAAFQNTAALKDLADQVLAKNWAGAMLDLKSLLSTVMRSMPATAATTELQAILAA